VRCNALEQSAEAGARVSVPRSLKAGTVFALALQLLSQRAASL